MCLTYLKGSHVVHLYVAWSCNRTEKQQRCENVLSNIKLVYSENKRYYDWTVEIGLLRFF